jgi:hypothetical protein
VRPPHPRVIRESVLAPTSCLFVSGLNHTGNILDNLDRQSESLKVVISSFLLLCSSAKDDVLEVLEVTRMENASVLSIAV